MIRFNKASITELEKKNVIDAMENSILSGDGKYTFKVYEQFKERFGIQNMLLTTSGTTALEMASILIELEPGDEIIVPSFTFSSTVNAFLLRGARPVFCDIRKDTMNIDENLIEDKITKNTKAIYAVDYAGIPCEMDKINEIANKHGLFVIEDAAQAVGSTYKGKYAGTLTEFGCYSFHETKNYAMGEGGAIVINQEKYLRVFLKDGDVPIDNSASERAIRTFCLGKKNWMFHNTAKGASASAMVYSISETAKLNNLRPYYYFKYILTELPKLFDERGNIDSTKLDYLMPWSDSLPDECRKPRRS